MDHRFIVGLSTAIADRMHASGSFTPGNIQAIIAEELVKLATEPFVSDGRSPLPAGYWWDDSGALEPFYANGMWKPKAGARYIKARKPAFPPKPPPTTPPCPDLVWMLYDRGPDRRWFAQLHYSAWLDSDWVQHRDRPEERGWSRVP